MAKCNVKNRTIFTGDNLDILRGIDGESVDLVYLDPPFNSNRDYQAPIGSEAAGAAFKDTWTLSDVDVEWHGEIAEKDPALYSIIDAAELSHSKSMKSYLIMMAMRLTEIKRIMKNTASIFLHCDPTASHYLKSIMDCIFGQKNFLNEIIWQYDGPQSPSKTMFATKHDTILRYAKSKADVKIADLIYDILEPTTEKKYKKDSDGKYYYTIPKGDYTDDSIKRLDAEGKVEWGKNGKARIKRFVELSKDGKHFVRKKKIPDVWQMTSLGLAANAKENLKYPTQKPKALLRRIITTSSDEGDLVLDPFCGCATTCIACEELNRQWIGIDFSPLASKLIMQRAKMELGIFSLGILARDDIPVRTDIGKIPPYKTQKRTLFGEQEGRCNLCKHPFPFANFTIDHIVPKSKGGQDNKENLQLLCNACNSIKGTGTNAEALAKIKDRDGIR